MEDPLTIPQVDEILQYAGYMLYDIHTYSGQVNILGAAEEVTGYTQDELVAEGFQFWATIVHPEDQAYVRNSQLKLLISGGTYQAYYRIKQKSGTYVRIRDKGFVVPRQDGSLTPEHMAGLIMLDVQEEFIEKFEQSE